MWIVSTSGKLSSLANHKPISAPIKPTMAETRQPPTDTPTKAWAMAPQMAATNNNKRKSRIVIPGPPFSDANSTQGYTIILLKASHSSRQDSPTLKVGIFLDSYIFYDFQWFAAFIA